MPASFSNANPAITITEPPPMKLNGTYEVEVSGSPGPRPPPPASGRRQTEGLPHLVQSDIVNGTEMSKFVALLLLPVAAVAQIRIVSPAKPSAIERLAAREVRRYFYLRTGRLLTIANTDKPVSGDAIAVRTDPTRGLGPDEYVLETKGRTAYLVGGGDSGTLYAAYRFAERLGVRFYLHGDVVPDGRIAPAVPQLDEKGKPLFDTRGIQPFHDFPEGPDWWDRDDYLAYIAQLPKLRMNFIGLHNYPEGPVGPEPGVWIGQPGDLGERGAAGFSYPSQWANTARNGMWGYAAMKTSEFSGGANLLFESDDFGPAVMKGLMPSPATPEDSNKLFNQAGEMLRAAFAEAKALGVKTCIGTETPLTIPKLVQERLKAQGKDPKDLATVRGLYEGMFRRIAALYPVDYYWLWTPENWLGGNKPEQFDATVKDLQAALDALKNIGKPFTLATSGWVLGPQNDRAALDRFLPKDVPMSCINRLVGHAPDELGFANIKGRPKWVIPWMENDPNLGSPQPWAGRMRYDAVDARRLGCTGLLGIHWRTKILAGNIAALADAAWDQSWVPADFDTSPIPPQPAEAAAPLPAASGAGQNANPLRGRAMPVDDFYLDFARANFGASIAQPAGRILARIDGVNLGEATAWLRGPGGIGPNPAPWTEVQKRYAFVDELAALRPKVEGPGNLERYDYWLNTYRYMAALAEAGCLRGELDKAVAAKDFTLALSVRISLARAWERMVAFQMAAAGTPGELGTLANLEQHSRGTLKFLVAHDDAIAKALGKALPESVEPAKVYSGPARIIVPDVRTLAEKGEALNIKAIAIDKQPVKTVSAYWRPLGGKSFRQAGVKHVARAVYTLSLPPVEGDIEYYIQVETAAGKKVTWPATAPDLNQTVVVSE